MGDRKPRPKRDKKKTGLVTAQPPPDYQDETPKFCLHHLQKGFAVTDLTEGRGGDFAVRLERLCEHTWKALQQMGKHGLGSEKVTWPLKPKVPENLTQTSLWAFRYTGDNRPMVGYRSNDVFHVVWIEDRFGDLYDHG